MGNYVSACSFMISPVIKSNKAARVIFPAGEIRQFRQSVNAAEIMLECPGFFLVNSRSLTIHRRFSPLAADEDLVAGNVYISFPMRRVNSMVKPADMAVFWMAGKGAGKRISGRVSPAKAEEEVPEPARLMMESPGFSYRVLVCRSRKPLLDTITEETVCSR